MKILSSWDLHKGKTGTWDKQGILNEPIQTLPRKEKDKAWKQANLDWWEHLGILQLREKYKRLKKNYNLASGVIDKSDYIPDVTQNEYGEMINILTQENESPYEIRFYPIIPNVINVLSGEFAKRSNKVSIKAIDPYATNERLEKKKDMIGDFLIQKTQQSLMIKMAEQGIPIDAPEAQEQIQNVPNLPEIEEFFKKSYRSTAEQWAIHELNEAEERFKLYELETQAFKDKLIANESFFHVKLLERDYFVELWSPLQTFYQKSPDVSYISQGKFVGRISAVTVADVIDRFGSDMTEDQIKSLTKVCGPRAIQSKLMPMDATTTDYWNSTKKPSEQIKSIHFNDAITAKTLYDGGLSTPMLEFLKEDDASYMFNDLLIVTEVYWKSQKKIGHLKQIDEKGVLFEDTVGEDFVVTMPPEYDLTINKEKTKDNLIYGQHVDWNYINEVWQGTKIGVTFINSWAGMSDNFEPIYINVRPLPFQFKGEDSLYGAKLPVEGFVGYNRGVRKTGLVDQMKPFQVGYNMVNNQMFDMLVDEIGNVILFDQNMIPRNSLDGSWGKYNFSKAFQVMKNFGMMPIDSSITNTDVPVNFSQTQVVSLEKTNQLTTRVQLSEYFKNECYASVGISRQRLGDVTSSESATGVEYSVNNSYAQTEMYFIEHSNYLMPRVKEMILNAAQYINGNKDVVQKNYINREEENIFFEIEGTKILLSDLKIYCTSRPDQKAVIDQLKSLAIENNTAGATIFDLAKIMQSNSVSEILETLKTSVENMQAQQQQQLQVQEQTTQAQIESQERLAEAEREFEASENELNRANERYVAEIRALGFAKDQDLNDNMVPDPLEVSKFNAELGKQENDILFQDRQFSAEQAKAARERQLKERELELKRRQLAEDVRLKEEQLKVERENMKNDEKIARINAKNRPKPSSKKK